MLYRKISIPGALVNCLQGPAIISMKSIVNKIIPAQELGEYRYPNNSHTHIVIIEHFYNFIVFLL